MATASEVPCAYGEADEFPEPTQCLVFDVSRALGVEGEIDIEGVSEKVSQCSDLERTRSDVSEISRPCLGDGRIENRRGFVESGQDIDASFRKPVVKEGLQLRGDIRLAFACPIEFGPGPTYEVCGVLQCRLTSIAETQGSCAGFHSPIVSAWTSIGRSFPDLRIQLGPLTLARMEATIFDGHTTTACSVEEATAAADRPGISWIDIRLESGDTAAGSQMLQAVGIDPAATHEVMTNGLGTDFTISPTEVSGVCWLDDNDGSPAVQVFFSWNQRRLVTVRTSGDAAIAQVRQRVTQRTAVLEADNSTLPGVVLQFMLATVQTGLTKQMVDVSSLDMQIIATAAPKAEQSARLQQMRQAFSHLAMRFPLYQVNVQAALIDPGTVEGLDQAGLGQMQQFLASVQSTSNLIGSLADAIKAATQDVQAQVSAWQGARINVLTIVTMIFLPITFLTGYFGMNFAWLDDQLNSFGMWLFLGLAVPVVIVIVSAALLRSGGYSVPKLFKHRDNP